MDSKPINRLSQPLSRISSGVPAELHRFHMADQFSGPGDIADEIIVDKHNLARTESVDFLDHIFDGPVQVSAEHIFTAIVAELTFKRAAAAGTYDTGI